MKRYVPIRTGLALAALTALTSLAIAQTPPRGGEVFSVWSSGDRALYSRHQLARMPPNEVMPGLDDAVAGPVPPSQRNGLLVDEPEGAAFLHSCMKLAAPREVEQSHGHC